MTAEERFEKLGLYKQAIDKSYIDEVIMYSNSNCDLIIQFYLKSKNVAIDSLNEKQGKRYKFNYRILQAINKQIEELGWNYENRRRILHKNYTWNNSKDS